MTATEQTGRLRGALLATQIAVATVLVLGATLVGRGIQHTLSTPSDFALETTTAIALGVPPDRDYNATDASRIRTELAHQLQQSGLRAGLADRVPASGSAAFSTMTRRTGSEVLVDTSLVPLSRSAYDVLDLTLAAGRWSSDDQQAAEAVVNETLARALWPDQEALGQGLVLAFNGRTYTVVGVSRDAHLTGLDEVDATLHIAPLLGLPVVLFRSDPATEQQVSTLIQAVDPALTLEIGPLAEGVTETIQGAMVGAAIAGSLGLVALLLAMLGIFGVFSYLVEERRREIGIRLALGAGRWQVAAALFRATRAPLAVGICGGLVLSALTAVALQAFLFGLSPADPTSYVFVVTVLAASALIATAIPIARAVRLAPALTLKAD